MMRLTLDLLCTAPFKLFTNISLTASALALYAFAKPVDGSYLGQFTGATSVFINEIPSTLTGLIAF